MNFLGIGTQELLLIFVIVLLVLGPEQMVNTGAKIGDFIRKVVTSDAWKMMRTTTQELRKMPTKLAREAGLEEFRKQINDQGSLNTLGTDLEDIGSIDPALDAWTTKPKKEESEKPQEDSPTPKEETETKPLSTQDDQPSLPDKPENKK